jgi:hypothetical protein
MRRLSSSVTGLIIFSSQRRDVGRAGDRQQRLLITTPPKCSILAAC